MKNLFAIIILCLVPFVASIRAVSLEAEVSNYLAPYIQMKDFSGAVLIAKDGKVLVRKAYGMANYELGVPNSPQTRFHIASVTKAFMGAAIVLLEKDGKLKFDDPLSKYMPDFPNAEKIKIFHLLEHSSGLPEVYSLPEYEDIKTKSLTRDELFNLLKATPLRFEPGTKSGYTSAGYAILSYVVEKITGKSYEDFLQERIFKPLKMENTGFWSDPDIIRNRASGYDTWLNSAGLINTPYYGKFVLIGGGALYSTVDDLYIWYKAVRAGKLFKIESLKYPYGWGVRKRFNRDLIEQDGSDPGFVAHISAYLKDDLCVIVLSNIRSGAINKIKEDLAAIALGEKYTPQPIRNIAKVSPKFYDDYAGQYQISPDMILTVKKEGENLYLKGTGGYFLPLEPLSENSFFYRQFYVPLTFDRDKQGKVNQLIWNGNFPIKKIN